MTTTTSRAAATSDYFHLDDELTPEETAIRDKVREFAETASPARHQRVLGDGRSSPTSCCLRWLNSASSAPIIQGYGCPGMSRKAAGMVAREMARADGSINTFLGVHSNLCMGALNMLGNDEQRQRWLPAMATARRRPAPSP